MIKLKVDTVGYTDDSQFLEVKQYKVKNTTTLEHICAIGVLIEAIMDNDENMTIEKLCKLIKSNYKASLEMESVENE